jgi:hypothetical protein
MPGAERRWSRSALGGRRRELSMLGNASVLEAEPPDCHRRLANHPDILVKVLYISNL